MRLSETAKNSIVYGAIILAALAVLAFLVWPQASKAEGTTANVAWTLPACYTDGVPAVPPATGCGTQSPLPPADITSVTVKWTGTVTGQVTLAGAPTQTTIGIPCGGVSFVVFVTTRATAKFPGAGRDSNPASYATGVTCQAGPPSAVTAT